MNQDKDHLAGGMSPEPFRSLADLMPTRAEVEAMTPEQAATKWDELTAIFGRVCEGPRPQ